VVQQLRASSPATSGGRSRRELPGEPDGLGGEVDVAGVALVENQVEDGSTGGDVAGWSNRTPETVRWRG